MITYPLKKIGTIVKLIALVVIVGSVSFDDSRFLLHMCGLEPLADVGQGTDLLPLAAGPVMGRRWDSGELRLHIRDGVQEAAADGIPGPELAWRRVWRRLAGLVRGVMGRLSTVGQVHAFVVVFGTRKCRRCVIPTFPAVRAH